MTQPGQSGVLAVGGEQRQFLHKLFCDNTIRKSESFQRGERQRIWQQSREEVGHAGDVRKGDRLESGKP